MIYFGMLRRTPEPARFSFWVDYLDSGPTLRELIDAMLAAPRYRARFLP